MIKEIEEYLKEFKTNPALFIVRDGGEYLRLSAVNTTPEPNPGNDPIKILVNSYVDQVFDTNEFKYAINIENLERKVLENIKFKMVLFLESNLDATKPRQTKLYRWLSRYSSPPISDGLFLLYKYVAPRCSADRMRYIDQDKTHLKNTILILEAMQKRYS